MEPGACSPPHWFCVWVLDRGWQIAKLPPTGETGGTALALASSRRRRRCLPPPHTTRKSSPKQGSHCALLRQPRGRFAASPCCRHPAPGSPPLTWDGDPTRAVRSRSGATSCLDGPLGLLGTSAGCSPLNKLNRTGSAREMLPLLTCVQTCPIAGRGEQERIFQDEAPASSPNLHTYLLQPYKVCCHNTAQSRLSQNQQLSFSPATLALWRQLLLL